MSDTRRAELLREAIRQLATVADLIDQAGSCPAYDEPLALLAGRLAEAASEIDRDEDE